MWSKFLLENTQALSFERSYQGSNLSLSKVLMKCIIGILDVHFDPDSFHLKNCLMSRTSKAKKYITNQVSPILCIAPKCCLKQFLL